MSIMRYLCGSCLLYVEDEHHHHCDLIVQLKRNLNDTLKAIQQDNENDACINHVMERIGNMIERMVIVEDSVERLKAGEQTDEQGYHWKFSPEELIQRVSTLEMDIRIIAERVGIKFERIRQHNTRRINLTNPEKPEIRDEISKVSSQKHLEKCLRERNERIHILENINSNLQSRFDDIIDCLHRKQGELDKLTNASPRNQRLMREGFDHDLSE